MQEEFLAWGLAHSEALIPEEHCPLFQLMNTEVGSVFTKLIFQPKLTHIGISTWKGLFKVFPLR